MAGTLTRRDAFPSLFTSMLGGNPFEMMDRFFDSALPLNRPLVRRSTWATREAYAVRDKDDLVLNIDVPGVDPEFGIKINVKDQTLTVHTTRTWALDQQDDSNRGSETSSFAIELPRPMNQDEIEAEVAHGVLTIRAKGAYQEIDDGSSFDVPISIGAGSKKPELEGASS